MRYRIRQYLAGLLAAALMIAMLPAAAFAEDGAEEKATLDTARYEAASAALSDTNGEGEPGGTETNPDDGSGNDANGGGHRPR